MSAGVGARGASGERGETYEQMLRLADELDGAGARLRTWAHLGTALLATPEIAASAAYSPTTWSDTEEALSSLIGSREDLLGRSLELDADALVLRATVLTYRWIDDLQDAARRSLGAAAARALGRLAPAVELGGSLIALGLVETDVIDRDGVADYLGDLAAAHPDLMEHLTTGGGLTESLQVRAMLTAGAPVGDAGRAARRGGLAALGAEAFASDWNAALRDAAAEFDDDAAHHASAAGSPPVAPIGPPRGLEALMELLETPDTDTDADSDARLRLLPVAPGRAIALVTGGRRALAPARGPLRLVTGVDDLADHVLADLAAAAGDAPLRVMLVGRGTAGETAVRVAARLGDEVPHVVVDEVVTAGTASAHLPRLPDGVRHLTLLERSDPVALLGSLLHVGTADLLTVVYDAATGASTPSAVAGGRAADAAAHPALRATLDRWRRGGYLSA